MKLWYTFKTFELSITYNERFNFFSSDIG